MEAVRPTPTIEKLTREINGERRDVVRVAFAGRLVEAVKLDMAEQWDFMEVAGSAIDNEAWVNTALLAASVITIDGVPEPSGAKSREHMRRILKRIGEAGVEALAAAFDDRSDAATTGAAAAVETVAGN